MAMIILNLMAVSPHSQASSSDAFPPPLQLIEVFHASAVKWPCYPQYRFDARWQKNTLDLYHPLQRHLQTL